MKVTFARNLRELDELSLAWRRLESQVANVLPFQTYAWTRAWWQIFKVDNLVRCDELMVTAYWDDDLLVGVIPRIVTRYRVAGINFYHYVRPIGADPNLTEIRVPLILPYFQEEVVDCWLDTVEHFRDPRGLHKIIAPLQVLNPTEPDMFEQSMMDTLQTMTSSIRKLGLLDTRRISNFVVDTADNWEAFRKGLKRNIKESLRRCTNSLAKDGLKAELVVYSTPPDIHARLDHFCALHGERAKRQGTVAHPDYFAKSQHRRFLNLLADSATALGMRLFCLVINGQPVAMRLGFVVNTELYMYYSGYRQDHAKYSVMTTLVSEMIAWAHHKELARVNFSIGNDVSKTRWGPQELIYAEQHYVRDTAPARLVGRFMLWLKTARQ
jgi:CelD/BcsL family acetyltransferase involved in cellulose biosynthesis